MSDTMVQNVAGQSDVEQTFQSDKKIWRRFQRNLSITVAGTAASVVLKLVQTFVLTKFLNIDDYGRLLIVTNLAVFLNSVVGVRVNDAIFRFFQPLKEQNDTAGIRRLVCVCFGLGLASCLVIFLGVFFFSDTLARNFYSDQNLAGLFKISAIMLLVVSFSGIYEPILRLHDRFSFFVVWNIVGGLITLTVLSTYFLTLGGRPYDLRVVVWTTTGGVLIQGLPPLLKSLQLLKPYVADRANAKSQTNFRSSLIQCLISSNLSSYLKFATNPGDIFLLGAFSSAADVALYGLAKQCAAPLAILEVTIQTAITPEIILLKAKQRLKQLERLIVRYMVAAGLAGGAMLLPLFMMGRWLFLTSFGSQYSGALPIFFVLVIAECFLLVLLVFRPLAVTLDLLMWHNLALAVSVLLLLLLIASHRLNSMTMAYVQLIEAAILRPAFSLLVWLHFRSSSRLLRRAT